MKNNREIRQAAWGIVRSRWLGRLIFVGLTLNLVSQLVYVLMHGMFKELEVQTWTDFLEAKLRAMQSGLVYEVPSVAAAREMFGATSFELFITYIFSAIVIFGFVGATLKATRNDANRWFADSFGGFKRPLELAWLMLLTNLRVFLWSLLLFLPGLVAVYRYRAAWYLKSEHPEWSAWRCLGESGRMMRGRKWQAFCLDVSYLGWLLLVSMALVVSAALAKCGSSALAITGSLLSFGAMFLFVALLVYFFTGRTVFYTELKSETSKKETENVQS